MPYPEALAALISGKTEIDAHVASPPFSYLELDHPEIHRVFNSVDILGKMTVIMACAPMSFYQKNPKLTAAFIAAEDQAAEMIAGDKPWAAHLYNEMAAVKSSDDLVLRILNDPDTHFTATPEGVMTYVDFMARVGTIKQKPARWSDVFVPELAERPGS
jgi:NitT/TauT family transport system substrate-binding protein